MAATIKSVEKAIDLLFLFDGERTVMDVKTIAGHAKEHGFTFPVLKDVGNKVADLYAAQVTPEAFVLNAEGKLLYHGRIDDNRKIEKVTTNDLAVALDALLGGKPVASAAPRAFGCSIKRISAE